MSNKLETLSPMQRTREYRRGEKRRNATIGIRLSPAERQLVTAAVEAAGKSLAQFCRDAVLKSASSELG